MWPRFICTYVYSSYRHVSGSNNSKTYTGQTTWYFWGGHRVWQRPVLWQQVDRYWLTIYLFRMSWRCICCPALDVTMILGIEASITTCSGTTRRLRNGKIQNLFYWTLIIELRACMQYGSFWQLKLNIFNNIQGGSIIATCLSCYFDFPLVFLKFLEKFIKLFLNINKS